MPVDVPKEPKKYTTVYDNFKGVDYTNDASNVYRRRSPSGLNMLPDLDGRPHKRTGWEVKLSAQDFIDAAASAQTEVEPERTHYFSYGGFDFLMIFNSLGVFFYNNSDYTLHKAQMWEDNQASQFPPEVVRDVDGVPQTVVMPADANRAFFFEGQGVAGFYTFVESDLYRFGQGDNGGYYFFKVDPTVPIVLIGCEPTTGVGTNNQAFNMLTDKRTLEYFGDGQGNYQLPVVPDEDSIVVEVLSNFGEWEEKTKDTDWTYEDGKVTFTAGHIPERSTIGNVRITYSPTAGSSYSLATGIETNKATVTNTWKRVEQQFRWKIDVEYYDSKKKKWIRDKEASEDWAEGSWSTLSSAYSYGTGKLSTPDIYAQDSLEVKANYTGSWQTVLPQKSWGAYNASVDVTFLDTTIAYNLGATATSYSSWVHDKTYTESGSSGYMGGGSQLKSRTIYTFQRRTRTTTKTKTFQVYGTYTQQHLLAATGKEQRSAFGSCRKVLNFGNNIYNNVFLSSTTERDYRNRVWYCAANDPAYFPDNNFIEVGADDKEVMGLIKVGSYLGIVKKGSGTETSIYLAYATSFEDETTYAVKQSVSGIGAISTGAFNILNEEPLFLSGEGVMGINIAETDTGKQIRNRSFFINKRLKAESAPENAISFVFNGMYYLALNNHCYVLDGSQKSSWANEKTNLQYECYYLENIPAQCFARFDGDLCFTDFTGNLCRFKKDGELLAYVDEYSSHAEWSTDEPPSVGQDGKLRYNLEDLAGTSGEELYLTDENGDYLGDMDEEFNRFIILGGTAAEDETIVDADNNYYTVIEIEEDADTGEKSAIVAEGVPIKAVWSTIADDDEMVHFFKNLTKKGFVLSFIPESNNGVEISLKPDEKEPIVIGTLNIEETTLPYDMFVRKKVKKYKRLQIICTNKSYNDNFGVDQIIKTYTVGNYSKNRR